MDALPRSADVVVVGGGFAGLSTAAGLAAAGVDVVVLEAEPLPGAHSSGKNAAIARRLIEEEPVARLAVESVTRMATITTPDGQPILRRTGGFLLGDDALLARLEAVGRALPALAAELTRLSPEAVVARVPALAGARFSGALHVSGDGVVDIHALLHSFVAPVRRRLFVGATLEGVDLAGGRVAAVRTSLGVVATGALIDAAGFSANRVAALAGVGPLPFQPVRRHLFVTEPTSLVAADAPWVWDGTTGYYFRREGAGLLMCACDQTAWPEDGPIDVPTDPQAKAELAQKYDTHVPGLREVRPARGWAGLRILTPDHRFVIGADPRRAGFYWVAGLGGHGMTTACGVGAIATEMITRGTLPDAFRDAFSPERFLA